MPGREETGLPTPVIRSRPARRHRHSRADAMRPSLSSRMTVAVAKEMPEALAPACHRGRQAANAASIGLTAGEPALLRRSVDLPMVLQRACPSGGMVTHVGAALLELQVVWAHTGALPTAMMEHQP